MKAIEMPTRDILFCGHPVLRKRARRVREITDELVQLVEDMQETMIEAPGVGLAAPQVGEPVRVIVVRSDIDDDCEITCMLNPRIVEGESGEEGLEGCLSLPTLHGTVLRSARVLAQGTDLPGRVVELEADGLLARALQHEIDHLDGVLFVDRAQEDSLGWMVPDKRDESGYRFDSVTPAEVLKKFDRLHRQMKAAKSGE